MFNFVTDLPKLDYFAKEIELLGSLLSGAICEG